MQKNKRIGIGSLTFKVYLYCLCSYSNTKVTVLYLNDDQERTYRNSINNIKMRNTPVNSKNKIYAIGDSHGRDFGHILRNTR